MFKKRDIYFSQSIAFLSEYAPLSRFHKYYDYKDIKLKTECENGCFNLFLFDDHKLY